MKKIFYLASIAALALSSCTKDETTDANLGTVTNGSKIVAAMEADDTRTELVKNGTAYDIVWKSTDGLSVYEKSTDGKGTTAFHNRLFQLDNASDGLATGAFTGSTLNPKSTYLAVYPYSKELGDTRKPSWDKELYNDGYNSHTMLEAYKVKVSIPAEQEYVASGTFNTNTIPAISTSFVVGEDGNATVKMQPVVDYVMVDIAATENIENIQLVLFNGTDFSNSDAVIKIAGETGLYPYYANGGIRYATDNDGLSGESIKLVTKDLADDVSLAKANTYVFAIPSRILGMGENVNWVLWVNDAVFMTSDADYNTADSNIGTSNNASINGNLNSFKSNGLYYSRVNVSNGASYEEETYDTYYVNDYYPSSLIEYSSNLENTVFYLNKANKAFIFNPDKEALIKNELDLIEYIVNYNTTDGVNAYVEEGAVFDLSVSHLSEVLAEADVRTKHPELYAAINGYIAGTSSFPTIAEYNHEFKGNGASITNIEKPLEAMTGLFGELGTDAKISNLVLSNIVADTEKEEGDANGNGVKEEIFKGVVLASEVANKQISNITVSNLDADAVIGSGNLDNYNAIKIGVAGLDKDLNHVMQTIAMDGNLSYKAEAWAAVATVGESVFHTIVPTQYTNAAGKTVNHTIATLPEGAKYEKFVCEVDNSVAANVQSVLIGETSYWTGGKLATTATVSAVYYPTNMYPYGGYTAIRYAEELAGDYAANANLYLVRDLDMNYANNNTSWTTNTNVWNELYGAGYTVKGLTMLSKAGDANKDITDSATNLSSITPFQVKAVSNANFDGININVVTTAGTYSLPNLISGLSNNLVKVKNVNIKNIEVMGSSVNDVQKAEPHYPANGSQVWLGWLSATATDIEVNNVTINGAKTNLSAFSAAVGFLTLGQYTAWFNDFSISNIVAHANATNLTSFEPYDGKTVNVKGTVVGNVAMDSDDNAKSSVKFDNSGSPKFNYYITGDNEDAYINVLYNDKVVETLRHPDYEE